MLYADEDGGIRDTPVSSVRPSANGKRKKDKAHTADGVPLQSFHGLMQSLATLCRIRTRLGQEGMVYNRTTQPTALQARAFELIGVSPA